MSADATADVRREVRTEASIPLSVPTLTFIATANAVRYLYAEPVFMDCDDYYNIELRRLCDATA